MPKTVVLSQLSPTETIIQCTQQITKAMQKLYCDRPSAPVTQDADHIQAFANFQSIFQIPLVPKMAPFLRVPAQTAEEPTATLDESIHPAEQLRVASPTVKTIETQQVPTYITTLSYLEEPSLHTDEAQPNHVGVSVLPFHPKKYSTISTNT
jgi:hypothetical protein